MTERGDWQGTRGLETLVGGGGGLGSWQANNGVVAGRRFSQAFVTC